MEPPIVIEYRGVKYKRNPNGKERTHRVYYSAPRGSGKVSLHRSIWTDLHGPIPDGFVVHHIDGDPFNNAPENLAAIDRKAHAAEHPLDHLGTEEWLDHLAAIRPLASEWHRSEEGREWHKGHGRRTWEGREPHVDSVCQACGKQFKSFMPAKVCSKACGERLRRAEHRYEARVPCPICGAEFWQNKYRPKPATCGRVCGAELAWRSR